MNMLEEIFESIKVEMEVCKGKKKKTIDCHLIQKNKKVTIKEGKKKKGFFKHFDAIWLSLEVFNLLQINNTVSYLWVSDVSGRQYAVPNYLTARQINVKLIFSF